MGAALQPPMDAGEVVVPRHEVVITLLTPSYIWNTYTMQYQATAEGLRVEIGVQPLFFLHDVFLGTPLRSSPLAPFPPGITQG